MHGLAYGLNSSECKRQIAYSSADMYQRHFRFYSSCSFYEFNCIVGVVGNACSYREHVGIEYYIIRPEARLLGKQSVGTARDLKFPGACVGLSGLIHSHDNNGCAH